MSSDSIYRELSLHTEHMESLLSGKLTVHWSHCLPVRPSRHGHWPFVLLHTRLVLPSGLQAHAI